LGQEIILFKKANQLETIKIKALQESLASYEQAHEFQKLLIVANKLLIKDPNNAEYVLYKLKALDGLGQVTKNIQLLQHYVNIRSTDVTGFVLLYKAYMEVNNVAEALVALVFALSIDENDQECQKLLLNLLVGVDTKYKTVKINIMTTNRVGHLACEIEPLLRLNQNGEEDCLYIFISDALPVANTYLYDLLKSYSNIIESPFWFRLYGTRPMLLDDYFYAEFPYDLNHTLRGKNPLEINAQGTKNLIEIYQSTTEVVKVPEEDVAFGWSLLAKLGISKQDKIICLHLRDSNYLSNKFPQRDFSYHDYRDTHIDSYRLAIEYLIEEGYKVIRIGANSNQSIALGSANYFDFCHERDVEYGDFLEIFLLSICDFFIATTSGPLSVAAIFETPTIIVNSVPFLPGFGQNSRFIPKRLLQHGLEVSMLDVCAGKTLSASDSKPLIFTFDSKGLSENGYEYMDNSEDDIYDAVKEFSLQIKNRKLNNDLTELQKQYVKLLPENYIFKSSQSVVSHSFLKKYPEIFK